MTTEARDDPFPLEKFCFPFNLETSEQMRNLNKQAGVSAPGDGNSYPKVKYPLIAEECDRFLVFTCDS